MARTLVVRPKFDAEFHAVVRGRCVACGQAVSATVRHGEPESFGHCARLWATFNGIDVAYNGEDSMPPAG